MTVEAMEQMGVTLQICCSASVPTAGTLGTGPFTDDVPSPAPFVASTSTVTGYSRAVTREPIVPTVVGISRRRRGPELDDQFHCDGEQAREAPSEVVPSFSNRSCKGLTSLSCCSTGTAASGHIIGVPNSEAVKEITSPSSSSPEDTIGHPTGCSSSETEDGEGGEADAGRSFSACGLFGGMTDSSVVVTGQIPVGEGIDIR
ncbi:unnamed protein product [Lampetra fluviatilis]